MNNHESLSRATKDLMWAEPFWGLFLIGFRKSWDDKVPTAQVSKNGVNYGLTINPDFWNSLTDDWKKGILQHEAIHIGYCHLESQELFEDKEILGIADDLVVNQDCKPEWLPCKNMTKEEFRAKYEPIMKQLAEDLDSGKITMVEYNKGMLQIPPRGVYLEDFAEMKLAPRESRKYYYDALLKEKNKGPKGNKFLQSLLGSGMCQPGKGPLGHDWKEFEGLTEAEKKLMKHQLDYQMKEVAQQIIKSRGVVPGNIAHYLEGLDIEEPAKFDWRRYLRRFTGGSTKTYVKKSRRKPNFRFDDLPGLKIKKRRHVLLGVDTSGSVSNDELKIYFHEIDHISRQGTQITVVQCDAAIRDISPYKSGMKINNKENKVAIHGRGGTDFQPVIDYYNENKDKFTCMIYFTDGECPAPDNSPKDRLLWVLTGSDNAELPGYRIHFEN